VFFNVTCIVPGVLPTLAGTPKAPLGFVKGQSGGVGVHGETVTGFAMSFFNVTVSPRCPWHPKGRVDHSRLPILWTVRCLFQMDFAASASPQVRPGMIEDLGKSGHGGIVSPLRNRQGESGNPFRLQCACPSSIQIIIHGHRNLSKIALTRQLTLRGMSAAGTECLSA